MTLQGLKIDDADPTAPAIQQREIQSFDPLTQVSADAKYIVKNIVLWFVGLPLVLGLLAYAIYTSTR
jgi:hypothetical protein